MSTLPCTHADSFTAEPYGGNPACVVVLTGAAAGGREISMDESWMKKVAREMNLSETAFLQREAGGGFKLRWFTPTDEVDLCGHATLAAAHVLWERGIVEPGEIVFRTLSGELRAVRRDGFIELDFPSEPPTAIADDDPDRERLVRAFGVSADDILYVGRNRMDLIAEVTPAAFAALAPGAVGDIKCRVLSVTTRGDGAFDFLSRSFAPLVGVFEDPVCGSAHCCLGPYWQGKLGRAELRACAASARGGVVRVRVVEPAAGREARVVLGGEAVTTMRGELVHC